MLDPLPTDATTTPDDMLVVPKNSFVTPGGFVIADLIGEPSSS